MLRSQAFALHKGPGECDSSPTRQLFTATALAPRLFGRDMLEPVSSPDSLTTTFVTSAAWLADVVEQVPAASLDNPGLGEWSMHELIAHAMRAITTATDSMQSASDTSSQPSFATAVAYVRTTAAVEDVHAQVAERGRNSAFELPRTDIADTVRNELANATGLMRHAPLPNVVKCFGGTIPLDEYLRTRILELIVHGRDIQRANANFSLGTPNDGLRIAIELLHELHPSTGINERELDLLTGRAGQLSPISLFRTPS